MKTEINPASVEELEKRLASCNFSSPWSFPLVMCDEYLEAYTQKIKELNKDQDRITEQLKQQLSVKDQLNRENNLQIKTARKYLSMVFDLIEINAGRNKEAARDLQAILYSLIRLQNLVDYCPDPDSRI